MKLRRCYRLMMVFTGGAFLLQTGGCTEEFLVPSLVNLVISMFYSLIFGGPVL